MVRENDDQSDEERIETYLQGLNVAALRKLVLEASWCDGALREKLLMAAAVATVLWGGVWWALAERV